MVSVLALVEDMVLCGVLTEAITYSVAARFEERGCMSNYGMFANTRPNGLKYWSRLRT